MATDNLVFLPVDVLVHIFKKLSTSDLRNVMLTCKTLRDLIRSDNRIWRSFSDLSVILQDNTDNRWCNVLSWYNRCRISNNWHNGCYKSKTLVHHYTNYMPWLRFHNSEVLLLTIGSELVCYRTDNRGMPNCTKPLWKIDVPKITRQDVRTNDISRFVLKNNLLVCGNRDGCVAVYTVNNIQKRPKLQCHIKDCHEDGQLEVSAVEIINGRDQMSVVTGSSDSPDLLLCTLKTGNQIVNTTNGSNNVLYIPLRDGIGTKCLSLNKMSDKLAVGLNGNTEPTLFDVHKAQFLITAERTMNHRQTVRDIQWHDDNTIVYVTHSGFLQLLDIRSQKVVYKARDPFQSTLYCVKTDSENGIIVGSAEYSRCVLFDARKATHHVQDAPLTRALRTLNRIAEKVDIFSCAMSEFTKMYFTQRNTSPVYCLDFDSTKLISAVDRGIALLNFNIDSTSQARRDYSRHVFY